MAQITAGAVNELRKRTDLPMMECKKALVEANGDIEKAILILRERMKNVTVKPPEAGEAVEGRIAAFVDIDHQVGAIVEVHCRTAPSAKSEVFVQMANDLARHAAYSGAATVEEMLKEPLHGGSGQTVAERIQEAVGTIREAMKLARFVRLRGLCGSYCHHDGTVGVLLQVEGAKADPQLLRDVCMHITATNPLAATRAELSAERIDQERQLARSKAAATGKPADKIAGIAEGMLNKWLSENVLLEQKFVKDESQTVGNLLQGAGLKLGRYVRFKVGEKTTTTTP